MITKITDRQHLPLIVGGTGLYLQALLYDMTLGSATDAEQDFSIRNKWQAYLEQHSETDLWQRWLRLIQMLRQKFQAANTRRVIRALASL